MLTESFETVLTSTSVTGTLRVRETEPLTLRLDVRFVDLEGQTSAVWSDVSFRLRRNLEECL
ncbi:MAG: hypothetical protein HC923_06540 [Myxococcales bacterium]|nr:hypothetical protein [Myxococcales bacterium]